MMPAPQMMPPPQMPAQQMPMDDMGPPMPAAGPVQKGNFTSIAMIAGAGLLIFLLLRNR
jgi:hypothetical protein